MGEIILFNGKKPLQTKNDLPPQMEVGVFYDLDPPANIGGKLFPRVYCEYQVPGKANEYSVKGIPKGYAEPEAFILRFTKTGRVIRSRSKDQQGF